MKPCQMFIYIFILYLKRGEIFQASDHHRFETWAVTEYAQMWKWTVKFHSNIHGRGIKIHKVYSRASKSLIFLNVLFAVVR